MSEVQPFPDWLFEDLGGRISRGAAAGLVSGLVFLLATMGYVTTKDLPAIAPLLDISTIFHGTDMPTDDPTKVPVDAFAGLVLHLTLAALYGVVFALFVPLARNIAFLAVGAVAYGLLLYVFNFQIFGRILFEWFTDPKGPDQGFEIFIHAVFGLLLAPFFVGALRMRAAPVASDSR
ncbi:MAG: hypothetical protein ABR521_13645 [Gaiellaceae bacterium]